MIPCDQEYVTKMAKLVFTLRQKCAHKDNYFVQSLDITASEYTCLVQFFDSNVMGVKELSSRLDITSGGVTRILTSLEDKGIIRRRISTEDRRSIDVHLTKKGIEMVNHIRQASYDLHAEILSHIAPDHRQSVLDAIEQLIKAIDNWIIAHEAKTDSNASITNGSRII